MDSEPFGMDPQPEKPHSETEPAAKAGPPYSPSDTGTDASPTTNQPPSSEGFIALAATDGTDVTSDYKIIRLIGHGAYGEVYLARDAGGSHCAVKVIFRESFDHERPFEREYEGICKFERVSRAYGNQVQVFHVGRREDPPQFYYIMELADDQTAGRAIDPATYHPKTLKSELAQCGRLPVKDCLRLGMALTRALENLHENGLIHRDIKPANIIFVNGVPKLADIGLVTDRDMSVSYVGTEGYIPPEGPGSAQSDIYSLGKVLYQMSTGRDRLDYPELPTDLHEFADREAILELNAIIAKACDRDPQKRYQTAQKMLNDLGRLQRGESIRHRKMALTLLAGIVAAGAVVMGAGLLAWKANHLQESRRLAAARGLVAWWPGDGDARDHVGNHNATLVNNAAFGAGRLGQAFSFDGYRSYVEAPSSPLWSFGSNAFTIELWAKFGSTSSGQTLVACDDGPGDHNKWIFWYNHREIRFHINGPAGGFEFASSSFAITVNRWYHLAITRCGAQYVFFINGISVVTNLDSHVIPAVAAPLTIGSADGGNYFNGFIDDVRIYHRALDHSEIAARWAEVDTAARRSPVSSISPPLGLLAWWPGDGHCKDIVGNHDGVAINGADYAPGLIGQAFRVNGKNQYFSIASAAKLSFTNRQPFTLEAWVFRTGGTLPFHVIGKRDSDYGCWYQLAYDYRSPRVPLNAWTHLVLANDGSNSVDYLNGVAVSSNSTRCPGPNSADFQIGSSHNYGGFEGLIDDVRIYNRTLSASEIKAIYTAGAHGMSPPVSATARTSAAE